jgi:hypothetical protein
MKSDLVIIAWVLVELPHYKVGRAQQHTILKWNIIFAIYIEQVLKAHKNYMKK